MSKSIQIYFFLALLSSVCKAERHDITAKIGWVRYHLESNSLSTQWSETVWFGLVSPDRDPDCKKSFEQYAISLPASETTAMSIILAGKVSGAEVLVSIDDLVKYPEGTSHCKLQFITLK